MLAIMVKEGTKYACNDDHNRDLICLQSQFQKGPDMLAILVTKGTTYACNHVNNEDLICLQSR